MKFPTWSVLMEQYCSNKNANNPNHEEFAQRRYNYGSSTDPMACRLVFLKDVANDPFNRTLRRNGRFIWCRNLRYEGVGEGGYRTISFTVDGGSKRFTVSEKNILSVPDQVCVTNSRYFWSQEKTFLPFSTVFSYRNALKIMAKADNCDVVSLKERLKNDSPYKPGRLVIPRIGYFYPRVPANKRGSTDLDNRTLDKEHPCGIILSPALLNNDYVSKEFYTVRFGDTTYEKIHPVQMEIVK